MAHVTNLGIMPPWRAEKGYGEFRDERHLSQRQIDLIGAWARAGAPRGGAEQAVPLPVWVAPEWQLGEPDLIVEMAQDFEIPATGDDIYRYFVMPVELGEDRAIVAAEFRPGNAQGRTSLARPHRLLGSGPETGRPGRRLRLLGVRNRRVLQFLQSTRSAVRLRLDTGVGPAQSAARPRGTPVRWDRRRDIRDPLPTKWSSHHRPFQDGSVLLRPTGLTHRYHLRGRHRGCRHRPGRRRLLLRPTGLTHRYHLRGRHRGCRHRWGWSSDEEMCELWMRFVSDDNDWSAQVVRIGNKSWSRGADVKQPAPDWSTGD